MVLDLCYTDASHVPQGELSGFSLDCAFGSGENDFELRVPWGTAIDTGAWVYCPGTEYGGIVDECEPDANREYVTYRGRSWHGVLSHKIVQPDSGADYYTVKGDANAVLSSLVSRLGVSSLFSVASASSGITISGYQFERYTDAYTGICKMLSASGARLSLAWSGTSVLMQAVKAKTVSVRSDTGLVDIDRVYRPTNHLICLGKGELKEREVLHLYADASGAVSTTQTLSGLDEVAETYDYSSADSDELKSKGMEQLKERQGTSKADITDISDIGEGAYIGDTITATDAWTGATASAAITKKVVKVSYDGVASVSYETGTASGTIGNASYGGSGSGTTYTAGDGITISGGTISAEVTQANLDAVSKAASDAAKLASDASATAGGAKHVADTAVQKVTATAPIVATTSGTSVSLSHKASGATAGSYGPADASSPAFGGTVKVPGVTIDATGHVTAAASRTVTLPSSAATSKAAGLMSAADKSKLDGIASGADVSPVKSVQGRTGAVTVTKADVGLGDADNTADSAKSVASAAKLTTARKITLAGAVTGSVSFDGSKDVTITTTGQQAAASFLAAHPVGSYFETSDGGYDPSKMGGTWVQLKGGIGPYKWHRTA